MHSFMEAASPFTVVSFFDWESLFVRRHESNVRRFMAVICA
jgi:hypothetical protein